jgi:hypothetical protein
MASGELEIIGRTPEDFLMVKTPKSSNTFLLAVMGVQGLIERSDVEPLFAGTNKPQLVINVPSKTMWSGSAIDCVHSAGAAFGTLGDVSRAASLSLPGSFRNQNMSFFIRAMQQHRCVSCVLYVYDTVFRAVRHLKPSLIVAIIDTYHMSAEDVRDLKTRIGNFDIVVKSSNYGSITSQAYAAAQSMGAEAMSFGQLMSRLNK